MQLKEAIEILENYQLWRRSEGAWCYNAKQLLQAIDCVLEAVKPKENPLASQYEGKYYKCKDNKYGYPLYIYIKKLGLDNFFKIVSISDSSIFVDYYMAFNKIEDYIECSESEYMEALNKLKSKIKGL